MRNSTVLLLAAVSMVVATFVSAQSGPSQSAGADEQMGAAPIETEAVASPSENKPVIRAKRQWGNGYSGYGSYGYPYSYYPSYNYGNYGGYGRYGGYGGRVVIIKKIIYGMK